MTNQAEDLESTWNKQYESDHVTALKDSNLFQLEVSSILEKLDIALKGRTTANILELGCGTGELLRIVDTHLKKQNITYSLTGVDFSKNAILHASAKSPEHLEFIQSDFINFFKSTNEKKYDIILSQRSIMALMDEESQMLLLEQIRYSMNDGATGIASECFANDLVQFNQLRSKADLDPIDKVWHSRYLQEEMFNSIFTETEFSHFCSTYMLTTRILYPMFEEPKHNQKVHDIAASLPENGNSSFLKIAIFKK